MSDVTLPGARDHPRSRGVYMRIVVVGAGELGSSPLARGLPVFGDPRLGQARIIPARAGFTVLLTRRRPTRLDHPRSRGVYSAGVAAAWNFAGSSPLARGLPEGAGSPGTGRRIIPARAGFTCRASQRGVCSRDHPRSRGVYEEEAHRLRVQVGSSPLARGLQVILKKAGILVRIIPARAGFTPERAKSRQG